VRQADADAFQPHRAVRVWRQMRPPRQSLGSAGGGSPASGRTCKDEARGTRRDRPGHVVLPDALGALANPGTKGTTGMNTRPNIIAQDLSAVPAVRGNER
jgi:hypothetical protein